MEIVTAIALGAVFGAAGQAIRGLLGIKKAMDSATFAPFVFNAQYFTVTLLIGAVAGVLTSLVTLNPIALIAAGYAGADAIEGLTKRA